MSWLDKILGRGKRARSMARCRRTQAYLIRSLAPDGDKPESITCDVLAPSLIEGDEFVAARGELFNQVALK